jgi:hypothetical protein
MRKFFFVVVVIGTLVIAGVVLLGINQPANHIADKQQSQYPLKKNSSPLENRITMVSRIFGNITIDVPIPESPRDMRIYRGYFRQGDLVENITRSTKPIDNPIPEDQAPEIAKKILEQQYGGLPSDAQLQYSSIMSLEKRNTSSGTVVKEIPYETFVSWIRLIDGMRVEGGSDGIQVELGETGDVIRVYKRWRTYEPLGNVSIISARKAIDKLGAGEVLNPGLSDEEDVSIYNIHLSYYVDGIDKPETTLEPIWVFYGNTTTGHHVPFFVYARQFANFTTTPISGKVPMMVIFTDISDNSPKKWFWDFGDSTNSTEQNPAHVYTTAGTYNISLKAWNDIGSDTMEKTGYIAISSLSAPGHQ